MALSQKSSAHRLFFHCAESVTKAAWDVHIHAHNLTCVMHVPFCKTNCVIGIFVHTYFFSITRKHTHTETHDTSIFDSTAALVFSIIVPHVTLS
jgi:hypothetical protein